MLFSSEFLTAFASRLKLSDSEVAYRYRRLREDGVIPKHGRDGPNTVDDLVWVTLAVLVGGYPPDCAKSTKRFAALTREGDGNMRVATLFDSLRNLIISEGYSYWSAIELSPSHGVARVKIMLDGKLLREEVFNEDGGLPGFPAIVVRHELQTRELGVLTRLLLMEGVSDASLV